MRNTIYCLTDDAPDQAAITESVLAMIEQVQKYVPGYRLVNGPIFDGHKVSVFMEVAAWATTCPYAGNLDIMTAAAAAPPRCSPRRSSAAASSSTGGRGRR
jgi:acetaldehyde/propanal dehydrogenase